MDERKGPWRASAVVKELARKNRREPTEAEKALWALLQKGRRCGRQFRRQAPFGPFIVDFYCPSAKLVIEADGGVHLDEAVRRRDAERQEILEQVYGLQVIRFENDHILGNPSDVIVKIEQILNELSF